MMTKFKKYTGKSVNTFSGFSILGLIVLFTGIRLFTCSFTPPEEPNSNLRDSYKIYPTDIPTNLSFAGESVPLEDFDVRERVDREIITNTYWQSQTLLMLKRANRYFPIIEEILKKHGIPEDFKYLALAESGLTNAVSPASATGFWQLMEGTADSYGLETGENVDERYNLEKSTEAAAKYIKEAKQKLGTWTLAAGAYNLGISGIQRQQERQKATSYFDLLLNEETARYVPRVLALKLIFENPDQYGFHVRKDQLYPELPVKTVTINSNITDLAEFAKTNGTNYKTLKLLNPWLREANLENTTGKQYLVKLPGKGFNDIYSPAKSR